MNRLDFIRDRAKVDLEYFGRAISPASFTVPSAPFHHELSAVLLDHSLRYYNCQAPRGHAKTTYVSNLNPLHHIAYDIEGDIFIVLVSKTEGHSIRNLQTIKDVIEFSPHFRALYGYWGRHGSDAKWRENWIEMRDPRDFNRRIAIIARGADQQMRGLKFINQRPTLVVYDDPEDEINTITPERRNRTLSGLLNGIIPGLDDARGRLHVIGTPIHSQGLVNTLEDDTRFVSVKYKSLNTIDNLPEDTPEKDQYTALWPEKKTVADLLEIKAALSGLGRVSSFYSEYQCEIVGDADQLFRPEDFRYYDGNVLFDASGEAYLTIKAKSDRETGDLVDYGKGVLKIPVNIFIGIDPASSTSSTADYSVVIVIAVDSDRNVYVIKYWRKRAKPLEVADAIVDISVDFKPKLVQVESTGYQEMLRQYLHEKTDMYLPGIEIKNQPRARKNDRLASMQPEFARHKVYLPVGRCDEMKSELLVFPRAKHDDILDAYFYARKRAFTPYHVVDTRSISEIEQDRRKFDWISDA